MNFGANLRAARLAAGLSQADLAQAIGVDRTAISQWELGQSEPRIGRLPALAAALSTTCEQLVAAT